MDPNGQGRIARRASLVCVACMAALVSACGSRESSSTAATGASTCAGDPIEVMTIGSLTGRMAVVGEDIPNAAAAAERAVNAACSLGRPLKVIVCDDQSTPNGALQCGTRAKNEGYLALLGYTQGTGNSQQGAEVAGLPAVFSADSTTWDHTHTLSYPSWGLQAQVAAQIAVARALKVTSIVTICDDIPIAHLTAQLLQSLTKEAGISYREVFFSNTTTDFASIAARILSAKPGALLIYTPNPAPIISALLSQGADFDKMPIIFGQGIMTAEQISSLGSKLNANYDVGQIMPTAAADNAGIQQMKGEFEAAGIAFSAKISTQAVHEWSAVHLLATALAPLKGRGAESLTSQSLLQAVIDHGEYALPTVAPFNFKQTAHFSNPAVEQAYAGARVFSSYFQVFRFRDGVEVPVGGWQSLNEGFKFE